MNKILEKMVKLTGVSAIAVSSYFCGSAIASCECECISTPDLYSADPSFIQSDKRAPETINFLKLNKVKKEENTITRFYRAPISTDTDAFIRGTDTDSFIYKIK